MKFNPFGFYGAEEWTTSIDVRANDTPQCRVKLRERCVLEIAPIEYPVAALRAQASGTVTLTGRINNRGRLIDVQPVDSSPGAAVSGLVEAAVKNLSSWWLEPARREHDVRITYSYTIDPSLQRDTVNPTVAMLTSDPSKSSRISDSSYPTDSHSRLLEPTAVNAGGRTAIRPQVMQAFTTLP